MNDEDMFRLLEVRSRTLFEDSTTLETIVEHEHDEIITLGDSKMVVRTVIVTSTVKHTIIRRIED